MGNFIYPRTVDIHRPNSVTPVTASPPTVRTLPYSGVTQADETPVLTGLSASIQFTSSAGRSDNKLPADVQPSAFRILIPFSSAPLGSIQNRDIVIDDLGQRYVVAAAYWNSLGYQLRCELLEV